MLHRTLSALLLGLCAGCSSTNPYLEHRLVLESAMGELDNGELERAAHTLETLLQDTRAEAPDFALQRFFAAYLLTRAHESATAQPFLDEPGQSGSAFEISETGSGGRRPSRLAHLLAMIYHASAGRSWFPLTTDSPESVDGEALLPETLQELGPRNATVYLNLCFLAVHSELNFEDRIEEVLQGMTQLADLESCERTMDEAHFPEALRPWVYLGIFEHQKRRDEVNAYRFGVRARETGRRIETFGRSRADEIARWIQDESRYEFVSPANQPFDPALEGCTVTGTPNLMYEAILRTE